jgi:hypothetical protein
LHTHTHTRAPRFSGQHTTAQGQPPLVRRAVQRRRARASARCPASVLGCTRLGHHDVRVHRQEKEGSTRRPAHKQARCGEQRTTPRRGIKDKDHRRESAAGYRSEVDRGARVRTATTPLHLRSLHKNTTTRRPVHRNTRHDACTVHGMAAHRGVVLGLTVKAAT